MSRRKFIKQCGFSCLNAGVALSLLESCVTTKSVKGQIIDSDLTIPLSSFVMQNSGYKKYIIVEHDKLKYPIYVYRFSQTEYTALLLQCTHQGTELQVFGDILQCPAHGSEFDNRGHVKNGPASNDLRVFPVNIFNNELKISLKNV